MKKIMIFAMATVLLMVTSAQAACDNLVTNGDFETGVIAPATTDYVYNDKHDPTPAGWVLEQEYTVWTNPNLVHGGWESYTDHTSGTGNMLIVNAATASGQTVWEQTGITVDTGTQYTLTYWLSSSYPLNLAEIQASINGVPLVPTANAPGTPGEWQEVSYPWDSGVDTSATITLEELQRFSDGDDFAIDDISLSPPCIEKEKISGPEEIGIYLDHETTYVFKITYSGPAAVIVDTVPAEFEVTGAVATIGTATYERANKKGGPKAKSAIIITWNVDAGLDQTLTVTMVTRESPGKGHGKKGMTVYKPTSCEEDMELNDGATAYDPEAYALGDLIILAGPTLPLTVDAVCGAKPCTPTCLGVTFVDPNLSVDWDPVCEDGNPVVYNVYYSFDGSDFTLIEDAQGLEDSEYEHGGLTLTPGDEHCYKVEAEYVGADPGYESGKSDECCYTVPEP